jgi:diaminopimelate decarboxylase
LTHPHIQTGLSTAKFGLIMDHLPRAAKLLQGNNLVKLVGLHFHLGSQIFDLSSFPEAVDILLDARDIMANELGYIPEELSPGGGLAIPYTTSDPSTSIDEFVRVIAEATISGCAKRGVPLPHLVVEPGRSISGRAMIAAYKVISRKDMAGVNTPGSATEYLHVDGGMADNLRPALYGARYEASVVTRMNADRTERVHISGRYCESSDILIRDIAFPPTQPGDYLAVPNCGAYTLAMASNYNMTCRPAVVSVREGTATVIQRREAFSDLIARDTFDVLSLTTP